MSTEPILIVTAIVAVITYGLKAWLGPEFDIPAEVQNAIGIVILFVGALIVGLLPLITAVIARFFVVSPATAKRLKEEVPRAT